MLQLKSKMDIDPIIWQDTREGNLRNRTMRICDTALDELGEVKTEKIVEKYYPLLDSLLIEVNDGKEYKIAKKIDRNYQFNYFYFSSSKP